MAKERKGDPKFQANLNKWVKFTGVVERENQSLTKRQNKVKVNVRPLALGPKEEPIPECVIYTGHSNQRIDGTWQIDR